VGPHAFHVIVQSVCHVGRLTQDMVTWTSHDMLSKFRDFGVHFQSLGAYMTPQPSSGTDGAFYSLFNY
jgi:hypothetical protein